MAGKTSNNQRFFIATNWEDILSTTTTNTAKEEEQNDENAMDFIGLLPNEICLKIFSFLDVKSLCRSQRTCSKWRGFLENYSSLWRAQYNLYKSFIVNVIPRKRANCETNWKDELKKVYLIDGITKKWLAGDFSTPKSHDSLPGNHIQDLPTEVWGFILENELSRKQPRTKRIH